MSKQSKNFEIYLCLKIIIEDDENGGEEEGLYLSRSIQLPYIPQIGSEIICSLHSNSGRPKFTVRYVNTPLGYWTNEPIEKNYELVEKTEVITENKFKLSKILSEWMVQDLKLEDIEDFCERCRQSGWKVNKESKDWYPKK